MTKKETIDDKILNYLLAGNKINQWNSYELFQYTRLSATIFNLKARGYLIEDSWEKTSNGKKYKNYWIDCKKENEKPAAENDSEQTGLDLNIEPKKNYEWPD